MSVYYGRFWWWSKLKDRTKESATEINIKRKKKKKKYQNEQKEYDGNAGELKWDG